MRNSKEETKQRILDTAIKLISLHGFNATTTALIAKELGLSETIIFKYYGDKRNLLRAIGRLAVDQIFENIALIPLLKNVELVRDSPLRQFLKSIAMERIAFIEKNFELVKVFLVEMQYNPDLFQLAQKTMYPKIFEAADGIQQIIIAKMQVSQEHAKTIFRILVGSFGSLCVQKYLLNMDLRPEGLEEELERILDAVEMLAQSYGAPDQKCDGGK